jgi:ElaB/YqjD/DUF883 family membrane-anchored ribosome-binding protein
MNTKQTDSPTPSVALSQAVDGVKSGIGEVAQSVSDAFSRRKSQYAEQLDTGRAAVTEYARENPMRTIGVAALAGIALGVLFFRR